MVTDDMDLSDVTSLLKDMLERVGETERELRRLRKEGSIVPKDRVRVVLYVGNFFLHGDRVGRAYGTNTCTAVTFSGGT